ncbi:MAG: inorganic phosphate transporter [Bacteroidetes bacterium]|nr:inorganic phosphate transporter [Bacteroidota bacterium]
METFYLVLVIILFFLAISDLIVGVSNDAVNFLNSAVGSKVASFKIIMVIATLGILAGATFSSGMMEVARKGIFHPQHFFFSEIMLIFLAVMITDVILLDTFNTFGMPTSTTVSIVFELLGAAVAISIIKIMNNPDALTLGEYINSAKALAIISGILLSVVVAFSVGAILQYLTRMLFSFDYKRKLKYFGAMFGGVAITSITYFILIKGAKGASFMTSEMKSYIKDEAFLIIVITFVVSTIILQLISMITKFNMMKFIVLIGTFALAMAFAGNDLVNFIGVPLAGYESYKFFAANPGTDPGMLGMSFLAGKVPTPTLLLLLAGAIMVATLWLSKKAKSVVKTSLDLSRQEEGYERFQPNLVSRSIVRSFANAAKMVEKVLPEGMKNGVSNQFDQTPFIKEQRALAEDAPAFDLIRAAVILITSSILISIGTAMKLPLSTTYVTFMVAMGASLADGAWGRESAVYRVSGVVSVVGGWFFTAFTAFTVAFLFAFLFHYGGVIAIAALILLAVFLVVRSHRHHAQRVEEEEAVAKIYEGEFTREKGIELSTNNVVDTLTKLNGLLDETQRGLREENLQLLNATYKDFKVVKKDVYRLKSNYGRLFKMIDEDQLDYGYYYIIVVDYLLEITHCFETLIIPCLQHVDNHHKPLLQVQLEEFKKVNDDIKGQLFDTIDVFKNSDAVKVKQVVDSLKPYFKTLKQARKAQIKRIKNENIGVRNSNLYFNMLAEYRDLALFLNRLVKVWYNLVIDPIDEEMIGKKMHDPLKIDPIKSKDINGDEPGE